MKLSPSPQEDAQKVALFLPVNAAGHMQGLLAIANRLREDHNIRCIFVIAGPPHSRIIEDHGHQLIELEDQAEPLYDFEIEPDDDLSRPMDEASEQLRLQQGKRKRPFKGAARWPQLTARHQYLYKMRPEDSHHGLARFVQEIVRFCVGNSKQIDETIEMLNPDVIIGDFSLAQPGMLRSEQTRPWIRVWSPNPLKITLPKQANSIMPPFFKGCKLFTKEERTRMRRDEPELWQAIMKKWARAEAETEESLEDSWRTMRQFYIDNGCAQQLARCPQRDPMRIDSPHLNLYMFPKAIDYDQDDDLFEYPVRWLRCDSLIRNAQGKNEALANEQWLKLIEEKRTTEGVTCVIYFSLGSIASGEPSLMQRYIDYLSSDPTPGRLYIVSKGVNGDQVQLAKRNMIGGNYLPQTFLLQQANLAIIHGGNNSLTESLYYGKPVIVLPGFGDQFDNARRVEDLSLGKRLDLYNCTREQLLEAIDELSSNQKLTARAEAIGTEMRARDELGKVSNIVWDMIEKGHLSSETAKKYGVKLD